MSTFNVPSHHSAIIARLERLTPDAPRQWGTMTAHEMLCHLSDGYRASNGLITCRRVDTAFSRSVVRWVALHSPLRWPQGVKTVAEADQRRSGTKPVAWDADREELLRLVRTFAPVEGRVHPLFGPLSVDEWGVWAWRHADHHLRQFGIAAQA